MCAVAQVVEGSAPPAHERTNYDTVAYCGVVPVRVRRTKLVGSTACQECDFSLSTHGPAVGAVLIPSGKNDGVAVSCLPWFGICMVRRLHGPAVSLTMTGLGGVRCELLHRL